MYCENVVYSKVLNVNSEILILKLYLIKVEEAVVVQKNQTKSRKFQFSMEPLQETLKILLGNWPKKLKRRASNTM